MNRLLAVVVVLVYVSVAAVTTASGGADTGHGRCTRRKWIQKLPECFMHRFDGEEDSAPTPRASPEAGLRRLRRCNNPAMRQAFIDKVAAPIANKLFDCGMIP